MEHLERAGGDWLKEVGGFSGGKGGASTGGASGLQTRGAGKRQAGRVPLAVLAPVPPVLILGVPVARLRAGEALSAIVQMLGSDGAHQVVTVNAQFLRLARGSGRLRAALQHADLALCDSTPLLWAARFLGGAIPERLAGSDLVPELLRIAAELGRSVFWLGGRPADSDRVSKRIRSELPWLRFDSWASPDFPPCPASLERAQKLVARFAPDLLLVSWGCPLAEEWIHSHAAALGIRVAMGVGAASSFFAGSVRRAPLRLRSFGLEWASRMVQDPGRLAGRYARDLVTVPLAVVVQRLGFALHSAFGRRFPGPPPESVATRSGRRAGMGSGVRFWREWIVSSEPGGNWMLDLRGCIAVDSVMAGSLIQIARRIEKQGGSLALEGVQPAVQAALRSCGLFKDSARTTPEPTARLVWDALESQFRQTDWVRPGVADPESGSGRGTPRGRVPVRSGSVLPSGGG